MRLTDTVLLDLKHIDSAMHRKLTGHTNENILDCARYLAEIGKDVWIRHVLVPDLTDRDEWLQQLRAFIDTLPNVKKVEILPYHDMAQFKYEKLGLPYHLAGVLPPTKERVENAQRILGVL